MRQNTLIRFCVVVVFSSLTGGLTAFAHPQTDPAPLDARDVANNAQDVADKLLQDAEKLQPKPTIKVDLRIVGWRQAGTGFDDKRLGKQLRANWVMLNETQGLNGRLIGVTDPVTVSLLRNGFLVSQVTTDELGLFQFESATPGPYTIVGYSGDAFFAFGFIAIDRHNQNLGMPLMIEPLPALGRDNIKLVTRLIYEYSPRVRFPSLGVYEFGETSEDPAEFYGREGIPQITDAILPATTITHRPVAFLHDGRFLGRFHQINSESGRPVEVRDTQVRIIQAGEIVAETQTDMMGVFEFNGLTPGNYVVVASGADGLAVIGVELVDDQSASNADYPSATNAGVQKVNWQDSEPVVFDATLADPLATGWINSYLQEEEYQLAISEPRPEFVNGQMPFNFDPGFGGGGGGSGGYGFGDGLVDLLWFGAIGVAIADAARSETVLGGGIPLVSPFFP